MPHTLVILNPHADSGRAGRLWPRLEPALRGGLGDLELAVTQRPEDVDSCLERAVSDGLARVIAIGGDGTNNSVINALAALRARHPDGPHPAFGTLPVGTGRDWARSVGIPFDLDAAVRWLAAAQPQPLDIGLLHADGQPRRFLNIASTGLSGEVDRRVNLAHVRRPWTFLLATVATIASYRPLPMRISLDGQLWHDDRAYVLAVANGTTFGHGMAVAPAASMTDGLFDVVLVEAMSRAKALYTLSQVYSGSHLKVSGVQHGRAARVDISSSSPLDLDVDGEHARGHHLVFSVEPGALRVLLPAGHTFTMPSAPR
jgi:diacylglycerol kinase (ATP)